MPIVRPCIVSDCPETTTRGSRCKKHRREYEAQKLAASPWEGLYDTAEWQTAREKIKARDGYRCTYMVEDRRCANTEMNGWLQVHHTYKAEGLWRKHGSPKKGTQGWRLFVREATNPEVLVTLCSRHHHGAEETAIRTDYRRLDLNKTRRTARHGARQMERVSKTHRRDDRKEW